MSRHLHRFSKVKTFRKAQETDSQSHFEGICPNDHWTIQLKKIAQVTRRVKRSAVKPLRTDIMRESQVKSVIFSTVTSSMITIMQ